MTTPINSSALSVELIHLANALASKPELTDTAVAQPLAAVVALAEQLADKDQREAHASGQALAAILPLVEDQISDAEDLFANDFDEFNEIERIVNKIVDNTPDGSWDYYWVGDQHHGSIYVATTTELAFMTAYNRTSQPAEGDNAQEYGYQDTDGVITRLKHTESNGMYICFTSGLRIWVTPASEDQIQ